MKDDKKIDYNEINESSIETNITKLLSAIISIISGVISFFIASNLQKEMLIFRIFLDVFGFCIIIYGLSGIIKNGSILAFKSKIKSGTEDEEKYIKVNKIGDKISNIGIIIKNILLIVLTIALFLGVILIILFENTEEKHYEIIIFIIPFFGIAIYSIIKNIKRKN